MATTENGKDAGSSPELQTRFSFYNAEEFIVTSSDMLPKAALSSPGQKEEANDAVEEKSALDSDAANILKSLQDHELQRLQILDAPEETTIAGNMETLNNDTMESRRYERNQRLQKYAELVKGFKQEQMLQKDEEILSAASTSSTLPKLDTRFTSSDEMQEESLEERCVGGLSPSTPLDVLSYEAVAASKDLDTFDDEEERDELDGLVQQVSNLTVQQHTTSSQTNSPRRTVEVIRSDDDDDESQGHETDEEMTEHHNSDHRTKDRRGVLGPLSQESETGVVLEYDESNESTDSSYTSEDNNPILDSLSAAVSYVTGAKHDDELDEEVDDSDDEVDSVEDVFENPPEWDNEDPDELGYRIVRISRDQLEQLEASFDEETDEQHDEIAKDLAELQAKRAVAVSPRRSIEDDAQTLSSFPGVRPAGHGEMGDLEYFTLPIIFKSHVTGFEPTKDWVLEPGNIVAGQYLVEGVLGSAAFSTAYKCVDLNSNAGSDQGQEEVCLKVIKNTKDFFDQSLDEIKILELLRQTGKCHENYIVEMKTFFYHREHLIIVTELLRQNLFEFGKFIVESGEEPYFTITRLAYVARQCLIALKFVHSLGLVHSDVKPENILLASYSRAVVKLIDFGSSCYVTDRQSSYIQSRSYRAPEVCLGLPYDGRIDIWSLGCVIAEMFTGEVTFQNDSVVSMLSRIEAICGKFPRHMIVQGRQSSQFFTKTGFIFEETSTENVIDIFQSKRTTLSKRLGFSDDLMRRFDHSSKSLGRSEQRKALFCDFCRQLLTIDPVLRPTAAEALDHPLMQYAATLTEADVIYPSS